jgi:deoxyribodipyrimidine photo-lyase
MKKIVVVLLRQDFRLEDNLVFYHAEKTGLPILVITILDKSILQQIGKTSQSRLCPAIYSFYYKLDKKLSVYIGDVCEVLNHLRSYYAIDSFYYNLCYESWYKDQEEVIDSYGKKHDIKVFSLVSNYLFHPFELMKHDKTPYKVFTPFKRNLLTLPFRSLVHFKKQDLLIKDTVGKDSLDVLSAFFEIKDIKKLDIDQVGEDAAKEKLLSFLDKKLDDYGDFRDFPGKEITSGLSAYLHFGELSPLQIIEELKKYPHKKKEVFVSEIIWREFASYLLYFFPMMPKENIDKKFDRFSWGNNRTLLEAWKYGKTGYPIIDAGMRELLTTGLMHNRVRMIVGSFLVKNLNVDWRLGETWFWEHLLDADLASNSMNWQWVAGTGIDAAPYFRIFNPVTQSKTFDPFGVYIKRYIPELQNLPEKYIHDPSRAPQEILKKAGVVLDQDYPKAIVDLKETRDLALRRYHSL